MSNNTGTGWGTSWLKYLDRNAADDRYYSGKPYLEVVVSKSGNFLDVIPADGCSADGAAGKFLFSSPEWSAVKQWIERANDALGYSGYHWADAAELTEDAAEFNRQRAKIRDAEKAESDKAAGRLPVFVCEPDGCYNGGCVLVAAEDDEAAAKLIAKTGMDVNVTSCLDDTYYYGEPGVILEATYFE